jgi:hypothetical protein
VIPQHHEIQQLLQDNPAPLYTFINTAGRHISLPPFSDTNLLYFTAAKFNFSSFSAALSFHLASGAWGWGKQNGKKNQNGQVHTQYSKSGRLQR